MRLREMVWLSREMIVGVREPLSVAAGLEFAEFGFWKGRKSVDSHFNRNSLVIARHEG